MRRIVAIAMAWALAIGTFVLTSPAATAEGNAPHWTIGDFWKYAGHATISGRPSSVFLNLSVVGIETVTAGSSSNETFHCIFDGNETIGGVGITSTGDVYFRTSDLAIVKTRTTAAGLSTEYAFVPPLKEFTFPLSNGSGWTEIVHDTIGGQTTSWEFHVTGPETVNVLAGTFDAFVITGYSYRPPGASRDYYSDKVGFVVKTRGIFLGSERPYEIDLQSFAYQGGNSSVLLIVMLVVVIVVAVALAVLFLRRRKALTRTAVSPQVQPSIQSSTQPPSPPKP